MSPKTIPASGMNQMLAAIMSKINLPQMLTQMGADPAVLLAKFNDAANKVQQFDARLSALELAAAENNRVLQELLEWTKEQTPKP